MVIPPRIAPTPMTETTLTSLTHLSMRELHQAYSQGLASPVEATQAHLQRITELDPQLRAFITVTAETALAQAQASAERWARGQALGPLDGIALALKDNMDVAGLRCTAGTQALAKRVPSQDAPVWQRLAQSGAVLLGKLNMHEAALGATTDNTVFGRCMNPLREGHTPGGSSGGSAAAVAARLCAGALGSDTMGSVRIPAAYCGLFGLMLSHTAVPLHGVVPLSPLLDAVGPLARTGADAALLAAGLLGQPLPPPKPIKGLRVGLLPQVDTVPMEPEVAQAWQRTCQALQAAGAQLQTVALPAWEPARSRVQALLVTEVEAAAYWFEELGPELVGLSTELVAMLRFGHGLNAAKRSRAFESVAAMRAAAQPLFERLDVLLLPTTPQRSFAHGQAVPPSQADFTVLANMLGSPALAFPCAVPGGLPASCQLLAAPGQDALLLGLAQSLDALWV